mmetsp:Transcript_8189/g.19029  ORF Transcript_8189/g.19029 Transcript_8189/m.19029 type:complete len:425 (+) Transcript_8189:20-1294(+)
MAKLIPRWQRPSWRAGLLLLLTFSERSTVAGAARPRADEDMSYGLPVANSQGFASVESNHLQYVQEDINEWKFASTQSLQRPWVANLLRISEAMHQQPNDTEKYTQLREHLDEHCNRVYNSTCEWQFSPPFNPAAALPDPEAARESGAIVFLCCADAQELQDLLYALQFLDLNFNDHFQYPVLIFHENLGPGQVNVITAATRSPVEFHQITLRIPTFIDARYVPRWYQGFSLGFRHMIRFFTIQLYEHPAMQKYDYYWRLDSDSFLIGRLWVDPFVFMRASDYKFGFVASTNVQPEFTADLWELTEAHRRSEGITSEWFSGKWNGFAFYSNCEIARVDFWGLPEVQAYLNKVDQAGGIYKVRWPDSAIHFLAATMFLHSQEMVQLVFMPYWHHNLVILPQPWSETKETYPDGVPKEPGAAHAEL